MTLPEFSNQFDIIYNNITSNQAPGLNEYEKSVFLTMAQDIIVTGYFNPKTNSITEGYDDSPKRQVDFSMLMKTQSISPTTGDTYDPRALLYVWPTDLLLSVNEQIQFIGDENNTPIVNGIRQVVPITYDEYHRIMSRPYKEPLKYQAWRLLANVGNSTPSSSSKVPYAEIIINSADKNKYSTEEKRYIIRYVKRPKPIILENLTGVYGEELTINGNSDASECELDPIIHEEILLKAVELAKSSWQDTTTQKSPKQSEQ